jgi:hypothetical protein
MTIDFSAVVDGGAVPTAPSVETRPIPPKPFDLEPVKTMLIERYDGAIAALEQQAAELEVADDASNITAVEMASQAKKVVKELEARRKQIVGEPSGYVRRVNALVKPFRDRFTAVEKALKRKIGQYQSRLELERRKAEAAQRKALAAAQAELDKEAQAAGVEPVKLDVKPVQPEPPKAVRTEAGTASTKKVWTHEITDPDQVPRDYLLVDEKKIRQAIKMGVRKISGVRIYQETQVGIRT